MTRLDIPSTNLSVFPIALGTASFGTAIPDDQAFRLLDFYHLKGGNLLDTAFIYSTWRTGGQKASERTIGAWLTKNDLRKEIVVDTKGGTIIEDKVQSIFIGTGRRSINKMWLRCLLEVL